MSAEPAAHTLLRRLLPYLRGAARRVARRHGFEVEDVYQELVLRVLDQADEFQTGQDDPVAFAVVWVNRTADAMVRSRRRFLPLARLLRVRPVPADSHDEASAAAELADDLDRLGVALGRLSPRRREAIGLRFGLDGNEPVTGARLGEELGVRPQTGSELVAKGLADMADTFGADPARARVSRAEGISIGQHARLAALAG